MAFIDIGAFTITPGKRFYPKASMIMEGAGEALTILNGATIDPFFKFIPEYGSGLGHQAKRVSFKNMTFQNGYDNVNGGVSGDGASIVMSLVKFVEFESVTFNSNTNAAFGSWDGGAVTIRGADSVTVKNCTFVNNNTQYFGGAADIEASKQVTILNNTFDTNGASFYGGGLYFSGNQSVIVKGNLFDSNGQAISSTGGGAIYGHATSSEIRNNTFYNNQANSLGGAINAMGDYTIVANNTFSENNITTGGGDTSEAIYISSKVFELANNIFHHSSVNYYCDINSATSQTVTSHGGNVSTGTDCGLSSSDQTSLTPGQIALDPGGLANNGGDTLTFLILSSSVAVDNGVNSHCSDKDQRDLPRPVDKGGGLVCDAGAVEVQ